MARAELVLVTSQEIIKPSSPTPPHLKSFKICIFDQLYPTFYQSVLSFYSNSSLDTSVEDKLGKLKDSLSKTLTWFYPLAGRQKDSTTIDCNGKGVLFMVAKVSCDMIDYLKPPNLELAKKLLPFKPVFLDSPDEAVQVAIKANIFTCGGIAFGVSFNHKFVDGSTICSFLKAWAAIARENIDKEVCPHSVAASLFPPDKFFSAQMPFFDEITPKVEPERRKMRRFVFDATAISSLKAKARSENVPYPSSVEAVSGLIWKCLISVRHSVTSGTQNPSSFVHLINLRPRLNPPLPEYSIGNILWRAIANYDPVNGRTNEVLLPLLVELLRRSVKEVNSDYLQHLQGEAGFKRICKLLEEGREIYSKSGKTYVSSGISKMGFYEVDFGWGRPVWMTIGPIIQEAHINAIYIMGSRCGDGIEALILLEDHEMEILEKDPEFLEFAVLNPDIKFQGMVAPPHSSL